MTNQSGVNALDMLILFTFMAIIGFGFFGGITRVFSAMLAIYFAAISAAAFYRPLAKAIRSSVGMSTESSELIFFVLLFLAFTVVFTIFIDRWVGSVRVPHALLVFDNIGGAALGVIVSVMALTLAAMLLTVLLQAVNQVAQAGTGPILVQIRNQIRGSALVPVFLRLTPYLTHALAPWFPGGLPPILRRVTGS